MPETSSPRFPFGRHLRDAALISRHGFSPQRGALLPRATAVSQRGSGFGSVPAALGAESCRVQKPRSAICGTFRHDVSLGTFFLADDPRRSRRRSQAPRCAQSPDPPGRPAVTLAEQAVVIRVDPPHDGLQPPLLLFRAEPRVLLRLLLRERNRASKPPPGSLGSTPGPAAHLPS